MCVSKRDLDLKGVSSPSSARKERKRRKRKKEGGGERGFENSSMDLANPDVCCSRQADCDATLGKVIPIIVCVCVKRKTISTVYILPRWRVRSVFAQEQKNKKSESSQIFRDVAPIKPVQGFSLIPLPTRWGGQAIKPRLDLDGRRRRGGKSNHGQKLRSESVGSCELPAIGS